jgi:hypothetical protein
LGEHWKLTFAQQAPRQEAGVEEYSAPGISLRMHMRLTEGVIEVWISQQPWRTAMKRPLLKEVTPKGRASATGRGARHQALPVNEDAGGSITTLTIPGIRFPDAPPVMAQYDSPTRQQRIAFNQRITRAIDMPVPWNTGVSALWLIYVPGRGQSGSSSFSCIWSSDVCHGQTDRYQGRNEAATDVCSSL